MAACVTCGELIPDEQRSCAPCGALTNPLPWGPPPGWETPPEIVPGWRPSMGSVPPPPPPPTRNRAGAVLAIFAALVVLAATVAAVLVLTNDDDRTEVAAVPVSGAPPTTAVDVTTVVWTRTASPSGRYSVEMPSDAQRESTTQPSPGGVSMSIDILYSGEGSFLRSEQGLAVVESDLDPGSDAQAPSDQLIDSTVDGMMTAAGGRVSSSRPVDSPIGPARRFSATYPEDGLGAAGWVAIDGDRLVMVVMMVPAEAQLIADASVDRVVRSLQRA